MTSPKPWTEFLLLNSTNLIFALQREFFEHFNTFYRALKIVKDFLVKFFAKLSFPFRILCAMLWKWWAHTQVPGTNTTKGVWRHGFGKIFSLLSEINKATELYTCTAGIIENIDLFLSSFFMTTLPWQSKVLTLHFQWVKFYYLYKKHYVYNGKIIWKKAWTMNVFLSVLEKNLTREKLHDTKMSRWEQMSGENGW